MHAQLRSAVALIWFFLGNFELAGLALPTHVGTPEVLSHGNTGVRLLLERSPEPREVRAITGSLYFRREGQTTWKSAGAALHLTTQGGNQLLLRVGEQIFTSPRFHLKSREGRLLINGETFVGSLVATGHKDQLVLVNELPLEQYLLGILPGEMVPSWPHEALKAQAIAARTYALYMKKHPKHSLYDLERTVRDQVYDATGKVFSRVASAVKETQGQVLNLGGKVFKSFYHSRCGGSTELATTVWRSREGHRESVQCPYCQKNPFRWQTLIPARELRALLQTRPEARSLPKLELGGRTISGRVAFLKLKDGLNERRIASDELRSLFGYTRLKSTYFEWESVPQGILFKGLGNGHGVGLCQWGTKHLAERGWNAHDILKHYYPGTRVDFIAVAR